MALTRQHGFLLEHVCSVCSGRFLPSETARVFLERYLGLAPMDLRALPNDQFEGLKCPECRRVLTAFPWRGIFGEYCQGCGGLWLDAGEMRKLSAGELAELNSRR